MTSEHDSPTPRRRSVSGRTTVVWLLNAAMAGAGLALYVFALRHDAALPAPFHLPWIGVAAAFCATEIWVVHLHIRRDAHSFSLSEVPLILGLFFVNPAALVLAHLLGAVIALVAHRRQSVQKVLFNLANFGTATSLAIIVFRALAGSSFGSIGPRQWLAAVLGGLTSSVAGVLMIVAAIAISEGRLDWRRLPQILGQAITVTSTNCSLALAGAALIWQTRWAFWLLIVPSVTVYLAYRAYTSEREKHESLEFLHQATGTLHGAQDAETAMSGLLEQVVLTFRAEYAEIVLFSGQDGGDTICIRVAANGDRSAVPVDASSVSQLQTLVADGPPAVLFARGSHEAGLPGCFGGGRVKDAMLAVLLGETRAIGAIVVANRLGDVSTFDGADLKLFETLANHTSVALEYDRLEEAFVQLRSLEAQLKHQAFHDSLTQLANRALLLKATEEAVAAGESLALLFVDLDDFKTVNDSLGHEAGDVLLTRVAQRLRDCLGPDDLPARLGGDEFAILLAPGSDLARAVQCAGTMLGALRQPVGVGAAEAFLHASIGIAVSRPGQMAADLLRDADVAMYWAKSQGKDRFEVFEPSMGVAVQKRHQLKADLQRGIDRQEFPVLYQPLIELNTGRIMGLEALVRWDHPDRGRVGPVDFIPLAEETGQVVAIGREVLRTACRQAVAWQDSFGVGPPLRINVNLSVRQLYEPGLLDDLTQILRETSLEPNCLALEITESVVVNNTEATVARLQAIRALGVRLVMDDFGTGYSSLSYLRWLPIDAIKIPKPFVDGIATGGRDSALAQAIVGLGESLQLTVVAEGIETDLQLEALKTMGCELGQGYLFARPLEPEAVTELLRGQRLAAWPSPGTFEARPTLSLMASEAS
ncbi:MAG: hypothetical protein QOG64_509 [Acidimicrobiaceae bacterium]|nr:hypothetical protein [Acidimicrobiaceae bacterium]